MARIAMAYGEWPSTTGEYLARAFRSLGHETRVLPLQRFRRGRPNKVFRYLRKDVPFFSWVGARRWLHAQGANPDLFLWVESPRFVEVRIDRPFPCPTAAYVIDTHTQGPRLRELARQYDRVFVAQRDDVESFRAEGQKAQWLPLAADLETHAPIDLPKEFDVGFVGNFGASGHRERFALLRKLSQEFSVRATQAYGADMAREYGRCRLGFNKSLKGDLNMRVFEVMSMGVPLLTDRIENGLTTLFDDGRHFVGYDDWEGLRSSVIDLLRDPARRERIAKAGREAIVASHTYRHRAEEILRASLS